MKSEYSLFQGLSNYSDKIALRDLDGNAVSYLDLANFADKLKTQFAEIAPLEDSNVNKRALTILVCRNDISSISLYIALIRNHLPVMLLHESISDDFLSSIIHRFKPGYVLTTKESQHKPNNLRDQGEIYNHRILAPKDQTVTDIHPELALLLTTSGSTGSTKFVRLSYKNLHTNTVDISTGLGVENEHNTITTMPMSYTYGLSIINTHVFNGGTILASDASIVSKEFFNALEDFKISSFGGVPFTYETLIKLKFWKKLPESVEYLTQAGGKLKEKAFKSIVEQCGERDIRFFSMYGQTEATARMSILDHALSEEKSGSIGKPIGSGRFLLLNEQEEAIYAANQKETLDYIGDNACLGYAENHQDLAKPDANQGCLNTGDIAYYDEDGFYYIVGREKRFVKVNGHRVSLDEIETLLSSMGLESAVLGEDDNIKIFVADENAQQAQLKELSQATKIPSRVFSLKTQDHIPRLKSGKVDYKALASVP